jgi:exo-beta-1,3-glucanase (GH17 family)
MRAAIAVIALLLVTCLNWLWWWLPNRPVEIPAWKAGQLQSVSFAPYRPGQSPLDKTFPSAAQIEADLKLMQGKVGAIRTYTALEGMEIVPRLAGQYGLKVWHGAWLSKKTNENLNEVAALIDHARTWPDAVERVIVGNEVLLRKELTAQQLISYIRMVKAAVKQPVTYAEVWEFWLRNPEVAEHVDFITVHFLPYWEDEPTGLDRREADGSVSIERHIVDIYRRVQARFPNKKIVIGETGWPSSGRMRGDARPGRVEQVRYFSLFRALAEREGFGYNVVEAFDQYWKSRLEGTVGATWGLYDAHRQEKFRIGQPVVAEPTWRWLLAVSSIAGALLLLFFASWRRAPDTKAILLFAIFSQATMTALVQATWVNWSHAFYWQRGVGVLIWALLGGLFAYAFLRGIADSLTGRMADPSLYGARIRETWRAWRALPRGAIWQRPDLMAQLLFLAYSVLCVFYLVVLTIDWSITTITFGDTVWHIAIDGRYRDFPIFDFVLPALILVAWKLSTILRTGHVPRTHRIAKTLSFGRLLGFDGSKGYVRMEAGYTRFGPVWREAVLAILLILGTVALVVTEGAVKLHGAAAMGGVWIAADGGHWAIRTLFWNTQCNWFALLAILMAVPYIATLYVSARTRPAEAPPASFTGKW